VEGGFFVKTKLIEMTGVDVRIGARKILTHVVWSLAEGQNWAVLGGNGAGKTTFLSLVRGDIWPAPDSKGQRLYYQDGHAGVSPLGFRERTGLVSSELMDTYLRQGSNLSGLEVVCTGFWNTAFLYRKPLEHQLAAAKKLMARLGIAHLKNRSVLTMSQGEAKKVLIARGLVHEPTLLILDECCDGLDTASRKGVLEMVQGAARDGRQILYATHRLDERIPAITHTLVLKDGRIARGGRIEDVSQDAPEAPRSSSRPGLRWRLARETPTRSTPYSFWAFNVNVFLNGKQVLQKINWRVNANENWAVMGPNGAGKTTLLRLVWGDLYPALGGRVFRFGSDLPSPVWEIKKRITSVSSRSQADHMYHQSGLDTVLSGFYASVGLHDDPSDEQKDMALYWIEFLGLRELADQDIRAMSYGHLRKFLIARAMVTGPDLLLLDEPCGGLDAHARREFLETLERLVRRGTGVIYATHHMEELGPWITHVLCLDRGKVTFQGPREAFDG
jgi:molybdate transport system ATP-binding protein